MSQYWYNSLNTIPLFWTRWALLGNQALWTLIVAFAYGTPDHSLETTAYCLGYIPSALFLIAENFVDCCQQDITDAPPKSLDTKKWRVARIVPTLICLLLLLVWLITEHLALPIMSSMGIGSVILIENIVSFRYNQFQCCERTAQPVVTV